MIAGYTETICVQCFDKKDRMINSSFNVTQIKYDPPQVTLPPSNLPPELPNLQKELSIEYSDNVNVTLVYSIELGSPTDDHGTFRQMAVESEKFGKLVVVNTSSGILEESQLSSDYLRLNATGKQLKLAFANKAKLLSSLGNHTISIRLTDAEQASRSYTVKV